MAWLGLAWLGLAWLGLAWLGLAWVPRPTDERERAGQRAGEWLLPINRRTPGANGSQPRLELRTTGRLAQPKHGQSTQNVTPLKEPPDVHHPDLR
ncbi:hypothetical protein RA876_05500 [Rhodoferax antarcticus]|nr:hypothetical protein RA876_05500 [Rhodoferax antarcticus]